MFAPAGRATDAMDGAKVVVRRTILTHRIASRPHSRAPSIAAVSDLLRAIPRAESSDVLQSGRVLRLLACVEDEWPGRAQEEASEEGRKDEAG